MKVLVSALASLLFLLALAPDTHANTAIRQWSYADGKSFKALILGWDSKTDLVTLSRGNNDTFTVKRTDLSLADQAYVRQWFNNREQLEKKLKEAGGKMLYLQTSGTWQTDYYVYQPSTYKADGTDPMLLLFSSSGNGYTMMLRHFEAAEKVGMVLVTADYFSNKNSGPTSDKHFTEMLPQLEIISHDPKKLFLGGDSGGALRAYHYTADFDRPWAGVYANGGWLGRDHTRKYRANMRVAMINGHKDKNALHFTKGDTDYLTESRSCNVALFSFEGGHQLAPTEAQVEAFNWLLGNAKSEGE
ncbi:hypothetical protein NT6N_30610 [Oceaniferula spumae]|uniref:Alpha/beta hydrolase n=1 Tax=Oceaniferula spumae TaxID=2979115 RepID=A0AAT9FPR1_9BACT